MKQKKLIFNFFDNRNWKKLTDSRKRAKILADNRKSHHPIQTLFLAWVSGLPEGLGERKFFFSLPSFPFPPETPDTQASIFSVPEQKLSGIVWL